MFDMIDGVPLHPLFLHVPIVLVPLTALLTLGFLVPGWRGALRWPITVLAVVCAAATYATVQSGERLRERAELGGEIAAAIDVHETWGKRLLIAVIVMAVLAVVALVVSRSAGVVSTVVALLLAVSGATAAWLTYETGDRGSRAVWCATGVQAGEVAALQDCLRD